MADQTVYDTRIELVTPENIAFQYRLAGPFRRLPAYLVDFIIRSCIIAGVAWAMSFAAFFVGGTAIAVVLVLYFVMDWFYGGLFEAYWNGQTPGKRIMQIRVLSADGRPVAGRQVVLRNLLRAIDAQPFLLYQFAFISTVMTKRFQRLGDLAAGTMVVLEESQRLYGVVRVDEPEVQEVARLLPTRLHVSRTLGAALSDYVMRRATFPRSRRVEITRDLGDQLARLWNLPPDVDYDHLLCAVYQRTFLSDDKNVREDDADDETKFFRELAATNASSPDAPTITEAGAYWRR